jgi:hypothetical protein
MLKLKLIVSLTTVVLCLSVISARADEAGKAGLLDNLFLELGAGYQEPAGEDGTAFGVLGANWGVPLTRNSDGIALGLQLGGDVTFREDDPQWGLTFGPFARNLKVGDRQAALALLVDYTRTAFDNDLWALRPIAGVMLNEKDGVGLTGTAHLNRDSSTSGTTIVRQQAIDRVDAFWNRDWNGALATEISIGCQFSHIDEAVFGGQLVCGLNPNVDLSVGGEVNTAGDFVIGARVSYHFGSTGRHDSIHNIGGSGKSLYTPFPKRRLTSLAHETRRSSLPGGGGGGGNPGGGGGDTGGGGGGGGGDTGGGGGGDTGGGGGGGDTGGGGGGDTGGGGDDGDTGGGGGGGGGGGDTGDDGNNGHGNDPGHHDPSNPGQGGGGHGTGNNGGGNGNGNGNGGGNSGCHHNRSGGGDDTNPGGHGNDNGFENPGGRR